MKLGKFSENFFNCTVEDYKKLIGKCFIYDDNNTVIKVTKVIIKKDFEDPDNIDSTKPYINFLYEKYEKWNDDDAWGVPLFIWLQEVASNDDKYKKYCLTPNTDMNRVQEGMFKLGKDGNLYLVYEEDSKYIRIDELDPIEFEKIKEEAVSNDGDYEPL